MTEIRVMCAPHAGCMTRFGMPRTWRWIDVTATLEFVNRDGSWSSDKQLAEPSRFRLHRATQAAC